MARKGFLISGRVQGVGFRWWACRRAESLGLAGTVRNLPDGRVEVQAEGPDPAMQRFRSDLEHGPSTARVDDIEEVKVDRQLPGEFRILL